MIKQEKKIICKEGYTKSASISEVDDEFKINYTCDKVSTEEIERQERYEND